MTPGQGIAAEVRGLSFSVWFTHSRKGPRLSVGGPRGQEPASILFAGLVTGRFKRSREMVRPVG